MTKFSLKVTGTFGNGAGIRKWIEEYLQSNRISSTMITGIFIVPSGSGATFSIHHLEHHEDGPECKFVLVEETDMSSFFQATQKAINENGPENLLNTTQCRCADWTYIWVGLFEK